MTKLLLALILFFTSLASLGHAAPVCTDAYFVCTYTQGYTPSGDYPQYPDTGQDYAIDKIKNFQMIVTDKAVWNWYASFDGKTTLWEKLRAQNSNIKVLVYQNGFPLYTVTSGLGSIGKTNFYDYVANKDNAGHASIGRTFSDYLRFSTEGDYDQTRSMNITNTGWIDYWAAKSSMAEIDGTVVYGTAVRTAGAVGVFADNSMVTTGRTYRHTPTPVNNDPQYDVPANEDCPNEFVSCEGFNAGSARPAVWWTHALAAFNRISIAVNARNEYWVPNGGSQTLTQVGDQYWADLEALANKPLGIMCENCFFSGSYEGYIDDVIQGWNRGMDTTLNVVNDNTAEAATGAGVLGAWANVTRSPITKQSTGRVAESQMWWALVAHKLADGAIGNDRQHWFGFAIDGGMHWHDTFDPAYLHLGSAVTNYFLAKTGTNVYCREFTDGWMCLNGRNRSPDQSLAVTGINVPSGSVCVVKVSNFKNAGTPGQSTTCANLGLSTTNTTWDIDSFEGVVLLKSTASLTNSDNTTTARTLTINSTSPSSGVAITVSPADNNAVTSCTTGSCSLLYNNGTAVTITAPTTAGGNDFVNFTSCDSAASNVCTQTLTGNETVVANYSSMAPPAPVITATPTTAPRGGAAVVTWANIESPTVRDWFAFALKGSAITEHLDWWYLSCTQTPPGTPAGDDSCNVNIPGTADPGLYTWRLFSNDSYTLLDDYGDITVANPVFGIGGKISVGGKIAAK